MGGADRHFAGRKRRLVAITAIAATLIVVNGASSAQHATPSPVSCRVQPREPGFFLTLTRAATPIASPTPGSVIEIFASSPARPEQVDLTGIAETIYQLVVCFNTGDFGRTAALFTDAYWQREVASIPGRAQSLARMASATPVPVGAGQQQQPAMVIDARLFPDGRIGALVDFGSAGRDDSGVDLVVFAKVHGRWLIDDVVTDVADELGTPSP